MTRNGSAQLTRANHFVPQALLRNWSSDKTTIYTYALLVPHSGVRLWEPKPIRGTAVRRDLYTTLEEGRESDEMERWLTENFETPGLKAIDHVVSRKKILNRDWHDLARFYALQEFRTPSALEGFKKRWDEWLEKLIEDTLHRAVAELALRKSSGKSPEVATENPSKSKWFSPALKVEVSERNEESYLGASVISGRALWMHAIDSLMDGSRTLSKLLSFKWSIMRPASGMEWLLSDHPTLRVNFNQGGLPSFEGGVGQMGTALFLPVAPEYALFAQVGERHPRHFEASRATTQFFNELLVGRAFRSVYARKPVDWVPQFRPRFVNQAVVASERDAWAGWHSANRAAEMT